MRGVRSPALAVVQTQCARTRARAHAGPSHRDGSPPTRVMHSRPNAPHEPCSTAIPKIIHQSYISMEALIAKKPAWKQAPHPALQYKQHSGATSRTCTRSCLDRAGGPGGRNPRVSSAAARLPHLAFRPGSAVGIRRQSVPPPTLPHPRPRQRPAARGRPNRTRTRTRPDPALPSSCSTFIVERYDL